MNFYRIFLTAVLLAAAGPAAATESSEAGQTQLLLDDMRTFTDVFQLLRLNYVDELADRDLMDAALKGMVASLDPHTEYLEPSQAKNENEQSRGRFGGIGVGLRIDEGQIFISRVTSGGPADGAGVLVGDLILAVDGVPVKGRNIQESLDSIKGQPGTEITLELQDRNVTMLREMIPVPSVFAELLENRFAYLRISHFHAQSGREFKDSLHETAASAPDGLDGVVLDLRGNGGGVVGSAIVIADGFLEQGLVVYTQGRKPKPQVEYFAESGQWLPDIPLAVLIDGRTASASEILAGALQDHSRATLVGEQSYGKGTVQTVLQLRNGAALKLTTSRYFTPSGKSINESGISPDIVAAANTERAENALQDLQIQKALEVLNEAQR